MKTLKTLVITLLAAPLLAVAQTPGTGTQSPSADGARPSDGAITGGSIKQGTEKPSATTSEEAIKRCNEMSATLREQCLLQEKGAGAGGTRGANTKPDERKADPRAAPPPQNPR